MNIETGSIEKCPVCGISQANQHSLGDAKKCDEKRWKAREEAKRNAAAQQGKAA